MSLSVVLPCSNLSFSPAFVCFVFVLATAVLNHTTIIFAFPSLQVGKSLNDHQRPVKILQPKHQSTKPQVRKSDNLQAVPAVMDGGCLHHSRTSGKRHKFTEQQNLGVIQIVSCPVTNYLAWTFGYLAAPWQDLG